MRKNLLGETPTHLKVLTLDINLITEIRAMKPDVPTVGLLIWDKENGYNIDIKSRRVLETHIEDLDIEKIMLYNVVLPDEVVLSDFKKGFYIEESFKWSMAPTKKEYDARYISHEWKTMDLRQSYLDKDIIDSVFKDNEYIVLREGTILVCY